MPSPRTRPGSGAAPDAELLAWAAVEGRVIVTHDRQTMPGHAADRVAAGERTTGVFVVPRRLTINEAINNLEIMVTCSPEGEWDNTVRYLPL